MIGAVDFTIKQGDVHEPLDRTLTDSSGTAVDLTGATVTFTMRKHGTTDAAKVDGASVTLISAADGQVRYSWAAADTDTEGLYDGEFLVTFTDTTTQRFPSDGYLIIHVVGHLA